MSSRNLRWRAEDMNKSFHWTNQRMHLVTKLLGVLSGILQEWNTFISSGGDIGYLSDLATIPTNSPEFRHPDHAGQSLRSIKQQFEKLEYDRQKLVSLKESFSSDFSTVS